MDHLRRWFIGLEFKKSDGEVLNLTLTYEIQMFTNAGLQVTYVVCDVECSNLSVSDGLWAYDQQQF